MRADDGPDYCNCNPCLSPPLGRDAYELASSRLGKERTDPLVRPVRPNSSELWHFTA
jgi:hypothetical protein